MQTFIDHEERYLHDGNTKIKNALVPSLETTDRRLAIVRGQALAAQTDAIFQQITIAKKSGSLDPISIDYTMKIDPNEL